MPATMPSVALRFAGETTREVAVNDRLEAVQESDVPISTPMPSSSESGPVASTVTTRPAAKQTLGNRVAFAASIQEGKGVLETAASSAAAQEITGLVKEIKKFQSRPLKAAA